MLTWNFSFRTGNGERFLSRLIIPLACVALLWPTTLRAEEIPVRHIEGVVHGFLVLRTVEGEVIANGDLKQVVKGGRVTDHLIFRFKDGSIYDETTVFSQRGTFRLLSDRLEQQGPSFKHPVDASIDASTGRVTVRSTDDDGKERIVRHRLELPPDVSNGLILTLLKNIKPTAQQTTLSIVAATSKPKLVKLVIVPQGENTFSVGVISYKATHYVVKVEIEGVAGVAAKLSKKRPATGGRPGVFGLTCTSAPIIPVSGIATKRFV
jgi:hypothetical protein